MGTDSFPVSHSWAGGAAESGGMHRSVVPCAHVFPGGSMDQTLTWLRSHIYLKTMDHAWVARCTLVRAAASPNLNSGLGQPRSMREEGRYFLP